MQRIKEKYCPVRRELKLDHECWWWYDDDDNDYWNDYDGYYDRYQFEYLEKTFDSELQGYYLENKEYYTRRRKQENYTPYRIIDIINSIYTKSERREMLIDRLLNEEEDNSFRRPIFKDLFKDILEKAS